MIIRNEIRGDHREIEGNSENDSISGGNDVPNWIWGWDGNDTLRGSDGSDMLDGGNGNDVLEGGRGFDQIGGGYGSDTYIYSAGDGFDIIGSAPWDGGTDTLLLHGIRPRDVSLSQGWDGSDYFGLNVYTGGAGDRLLFKGFFRSTLDGVGSSNPLQQIKFDNGVVWTAQQIAAKVFLSGNPGENYILMGTSLGDRIISGGTLYGNDGNDTIDGLEGNDALIGGQGDDVLRGGAGFDGLNGGFGADKLYGGDGGDTLDGGDGNDLLSGDAGDDWLWGRDGADNMKGGDGHDILIGAEGADVLSGGSGNDVFFYSFSYESTAFNRDRITDFNAAEGDQIRLAFIGTPSLTSKFNHHAGDVVQTHSAAGLVVRVDSDGDGSGDFVILLAGVTEELTSAQFA
jgi:Ca2+-binding RTX toxin-like protein